MEKSMEIPKKKKKKKKELLYDPATPSPGI